MLSWLEKAGTWAMHHLPDLLRIFGSKADSARIAAWANQSKARLSSGGASVLLYSITSTAASCVHAARMHRSLRFRRIVLGGCVALVISYCGLWWFGTAGFLAEAQSFLPWRIYRQSVESARAMLNTKALADSGATEHLVAFVGRTNRISEAIFTATFILLVSVLIAAVLRISLRLAQLLFDDLAGVTSFSPFFLTMIGAFCLRIGIESAALGFMTLAQDPPMLIVLSPLIRITPHAPGVVGAIVALLFAGLSGVSWLVQPTIAMWIVHILTIPLRLVSYLMAICAIISLLKTLAVRGACFALSWVEDQFTKAK